MSERLRIAPQRRSMHTDVATATTSTDTRSTTGSTGGPPATALAPRLRREWQHLRRRRDLIEQARKWGVTDRHFDDLEQLLALAGYQGEGTPDGDDVLRRLVERAVVDELAARIVLQRVLPGLLAAVRRHRCDRRTDGVFDELVGAAWIAIRTFDTARRPACLAAALIRGAEHRAFHGPNRRRDAATMPVDPRRLLDAEQSPPTAGEELADVLRWARLQGLSDDDATFVQLLATAETPAQLAAQLGVTTRTVRNRRATITYRLRRLSVAA